MKEFQNITKKQIEQNGVQALSDRPNSVGAYGSGGLSPFELKLAFDRLATLIADKINDIHKVLASDEAAEYIAIALHENGIHDLSQLVAAIKSGSLANILELYPTAGSDKRVNLQNAIYNMAKLLSDHEHDINEVLKKPPFTETDPTVPAWAKKPNPPTPAEIGAAPALTTVKKEMQDKGWYKVGTIRNETRMHTRVATIYVGGGFSNNSPSVGIIDIAARYGENIDMNVIAHSGDNGITLVGFITSNTQTDLYIYYSGTGANPAFVRIDTQFGVFESANFEPVSLTEADMHKIAYLQHSNVNYEWQNPPMQLGVEYRTTERYQGKPVYVKLANFGALPNAATKGVDIGVKNITVVEYHAFQRYTNSNGATIMMPIRTSTLITDFYWHETNGAFTIVTASDLSARTVLVSVKYVKN